MSRTCIQCTQKILKLFVGLSTSIKRKVFGINGCGINAVLFKCSPKQITKKFFFHIYMNIKFYFQIHFSYLKLCSNDLFCVPAKLNRLFCYKGKITPACWHWLNWLTLYFGIQLDNFAAIFNLVGKTSGKIKIVYRLNVHALDTVFSKHS